MSTERILLKAGDEAPAFSLTNQDGKTVTLQQFSGTGVIVFFYPAAMTPGCTTEACDFRDSVESLRSSGYEIVGISPDEVAKLKKFAERDGLSYDLLSDPETETLRAYGAFGEKNMYGRIVEGVIRSTMIIGADGRVEHALYNVKATGHVGRIRKLLGLNQS